MNFDIKTKIKSIKSLKDNKHLVMAFILLLILATLVSHLKNTETITEMSTTVQADTIIPNGFILYPISLANIEAIKGVIHQYGVIDVYTGAQFGRGSKKILSKVKIIQAPYNQDEFALLLPEYISQTMMSETGPFYGVIQNRSTKSEFSPPKIEIKSKKISIEYQQGA